MFKLGQCYTIGLTLIHTNVSANMKCVAEYIKQNFDFEKMKKKLTKYFL